MALNLTSENAEKEVYMENQFHIKNKTQNLSNNTSLPFSSFIASNSSSTHLNDCKLQSEKVQIYKEGDSDSFNYSCNSNKEIALQESNLSNVEDQGSVIKSNYNKSQGNGKLNKQKIKNKKNKTYSVIHKCPFDCCGKEFKEKGNLRNHLRSHVSIKNYFYKK
jgi:hypothetical protein